MIRSELRLAGAAMLMAGALIARAADAQHGTTLPASPQVAVWVVQNDNPRVMLGATPGSYVMVLRVANDQKVQVLYPASPDAQAPFPSSTTAVKIALHIPSYSMGGIYAVASNTPFNFSRISRNGSWNEDSLFVRHLRGRQYAANRVFGMVTPVAAVVASDEAVYLGVRTAREGTGPVYAAGFGGLSFPARYVGTGFLTYNPSCVASAADLFSCPGSSSPYAGCYRLSGRDFCGSVADVFMEMARSLPPRERIAPLVPAPGKSFGCAESCQLNANFNSALMRNNPPEQVVRPVAPATPSSPTPPSPTPLPVAPVTPPPAF